MELGTAIEVRDLSLEYVEYSRSLSNHLGKNLIRALQNIEFSVSKGISRRTRDEWRW